MSDSAIFQAGFGYRLTTAGSVLKFFLTVFTLGAILLVFYWKPALKIKWLYRQCKVSDAEIFILEVCQLKL